MRTLEAPRSVPPDEMADGSGHEDPQTISHLLEHRLLIAANRAPVTIQEIHRDGTLEYERGSGGLVTALSGLLQHVDATWIACASTQADEAWGEGRIKLAENDGGEIGVRFIATDSETYERYYGVVSNPLLWFLQHYMWDAPRTPVIDHATWEAWHGGYEVVNQLFADAIVADVRAKEQTPLVMLQDYHLYLTARNICKAMRRRERPTILHFIHIPWPGPAYWRILPATMRQAILDSLCAVDLLGFQTRDDGLNFLRTCAMHLPDADVSYDRGRIWYRNHATHVRDFPISVDTTSLKQTAQSAAVTEHRAELEDLIGDRRLILRVDRIEPSKNIVRGFMAFDELLNLHPEHLEKVIFVAILVPSRLAVDEYQDYLDEMMAVVGRINARYGSSQWQPIHLLIGEDYPRAIAAMQLYDVLLVNAIADGMNLVAKEGSLVNKRDGVLILSESTGARQQLEPGALVISPFDIYATAQALHQALTMSAEQRRERAQRLHWLVEQDDVRKWLQEQLKAVSQLDL